MREREKEGEREVCQAPIGSSTDTKAQTNVRDCYMQHTVCRGLEAV